MQCEHAQEFFSEYIAGEMDFALATTLEHHLSACPSCADAVSGLRSLWSGLDRLPVVEPPAGFHTALMDRIAREQEREKASRQTQQRVSAWRRIANPRTFAYAATLLIVLLGAELVQVQRAALGPLGLILNVVHPAPLLTSRQVAWMPNGQGGGTLTVVLQAHPQANGAASRYRVRVELRRLSGTDESASRTESKVADLSSDKPAVLSLPLDFTPNDESDHLEATLTPVDTDGRESQTFTIPLTPGE